MKILFHYAAGKRLQDEVAALSGQGLEVVCCPEGPDEPFNSEVHDAEVIWHVLHPITAEVMDRAPKLKLIQKIGVGVNTIDLDAARERGIAVCNMPGTNSRAVAEMTLLLMLSALRLSPVLDQACRSGQWALGQSAKESLTEVAGKTVGFVGFGAVPQILAPILSAMGAEVIYTATSDKSVVYPFVSLDELLSRSDIVSLHIPLTDSTDKLINRARLAAMKEGAVLVNTARGQLVDEAALCEALDSGWLQAVGLDVFACEPVAPDNPLLAMDNVVVAPHVAWLTNETFARSIKVAAKNALAIAAGGNLDFQVV